MSTHHDFPKTTVKQFVLATLGGLFAPALVAFLIYKLVVGIQATHIEGTDPAADDAAVAERIKPVAEVSLASAGGGAAQQKSGEQVVQAVCSACHGSGALGSPKIGDKSAWGPRIAQGYETLVKHATEGVRMMPARGGSPDLTDHEVAAAVAYMANKGGASFKEPAAPVAEAPTPAADATPAAEAATPATATSENAAPAAEATPAPAAEPPVAAAPAAAPAGDAAQGKSGEQVVQAVCSACHGSGALGAPKIGDNSAWAPRIAQGYETLVKHATEGVRMMPARGGNPGLTDHEVAAAVAYMANKGGASFKEPAAPAK